MRQAVISNNESLSREAVAETGLGNVRDKQVKNALAAEKTPGVEDVEPRAFSDEHGLTLTEHAPYGVIGAITPVTNPIATITSNSIGMIAAGNSVVFNVHPERKGDLQPAGGAPERRRSAARAGRGTSCARWPIPTIESAGELMKHRGVAHPRGHRRSRGGEGGDGKREESHLRRPGQPALRRGPDGGPREGGTRHRGRGRLRQQRGVHL